MKKALAILMIGILSFCIGFASAQEVRQDGWEYIRKVVSAVDTDVLSVSNSDWGQRAQYSHGREIPTDTEAVLISVIGNHATDPNAGTCSIKFSMYRSGGPAVTVGTYAFTIGELAVNLKPRDATQQGEKSKWAESATETSANWLTPPEIVASGTDGCVMIKIPTYGFAYITAEVTAITASHTVDILMSALSTGESGGAVTNGSGTDAVEVQMTSPVKTSTVTKVDAWQAVTAATTVEGTAADFSGGYGESYFVIEIAQIEAVAHAGGLGPEVQVSVDGRTWIDYQTLSLTADTAATTTTVGALTVDANTVVDLTDATTGDFDEQGRAWFIKDGTIANSEVVFTKSNATHVVTIMDNVQVSHSTGVSVYDRVDQFLVPIVEPFYYARLLAINTDADCDIAFSTHKAEATAR